MPPLLPFAHPRAKPKIKTRLHDGGPSLSIMTSPANPNPIACKGKLKEVLFQALKMHLDRAHHGQPVASSTGSRTTVPPAMRHPRCTPCKLPGFVLLVSYHYCQYFGDFLAKVISLQVSFSAKKEARQLDFIKAPKSGFCSSLSGFASKLPSFVLLVSQHYYQYFTYFLVKMIALQVSFSAKKV